MPKPISKLLEISGIALSKKSIGCTSNLFGNFTPFMGDLFDLLGQKNGFYAFESALHVFPLESNSEEVGLVEWNSPNLWVGEYKNMIGDGIYFAEDIFGCQFCLKQTGIYVFDPETGSHEFLALDIEEWAKAILNTPEVLSGYPLAHAWQEKNGILKPNLRLVPKIPFVLGGEYSLDNLVALNAVKGMRLRANLAIQIRDLPDGAAVTWKITE